MAAGAIATSKIAHKVSRIPAEMSDRVLFKKVDKLTQETNKIKDSREITSKLLGEAKSRGIDVLNDPGRPTSYGHYPESKKNRDELARRLKKLRRQGKLEKPGD